MLVLRKEFLLLFIFCCANLILKAQNCASVSSRVNYQVDHSLTYKYINIQTPGNLIGLGDDDAFSITSGGVPFYIYGAPYTQMRVATNGYITTDLLDPGSDVSNDCPLPANPSAPIGTTGERLYVCHDDKIADMGIYYQYFPISSYAHPNGQEMAAHVIQWVGKHFGSSDLADFQAIIFANGDIIYQIAANPEDGSGSTSGIQTGDLSLSTTLACNTIGTLGPRTIYGLSGFSAALANAPCNIILPAKVPTLSQWGLLILALILMNLSVVLILKKQSLLGF